MTIIGTSICNTKQQGNDSSFEQESEPGELTGLKNLGDFGKVEEARQHKSQDRVQLTIEPVLQVNDETPSSSSFVSIIKENNANKQVIAPSVQKPPGYTICLAYNFKKIYFFHILKTKMN